MSERLRHIETDPPEHEAFQDYEVQPQSVEKEHASKNETLDVEKSRERIRELQTPASGTSQKLHDNDSSRSPAFHPRLESAAETLTKTLGMIRRNLSPSEERFSKVIHNPLVSSVSEVTAKTLARPYAILTGGVVACTGSILYMYYSRHLGYRYNFFVPVILFFSGLIAGIMAEVLYKTFHHRRKRRS